MSDVVLNAGFTDVDRSGDAASFVAHLDHVSPSDWVQATKLRSFELLEVADGSLVLDLGCGTGDDARALAKRVGPTGHVVGVDKSETMIETARLRTSAAEANVEFMLLDGNVLEFADASFDGCHMDRVLHHLHEPFLAFGELARVARPGGRIVVHEPDFEMMALGTPTTGVTRKIVNFFCDSHSSGWAGRQLYGMARRAGLVDVRIEASTWMSTRYVEVEQRMRLEQTVQHAIAAAILTAGEATDWLADLRAQDQAGTLFWASTAFHLSARKP